MSLTLAYILCIGGLVLTLVAVFLVAHWGEHEQKPEPTFYWHAAGDVHLLVNSDTLIIVARVRRIRGAWRGNTIGSGNVIDYISLDAAKRHIEDHVVSL